MAVGRDIRAGKAFIELSIRSKIVRGLRAAQRRLRAFGQSMSMVGRSMVRMAAMAALPIALATRTFVGFHDQMMTVKAVTGATADEFQRLYDLAKKLGRTTSFTAAQVAGGQVSLGRAGFSPQEIETATASMLDLARATSTDLPEAAEIAAGTLRAFNLDAGEMTRVSDVLTATANGSAQTLTDLGESMKYIAPIAFQAGQSLESAAKMVGILANMQIKGSMAGTSYKNILLQLADPAVQKQLQGMGIAVVNMAGDMREPADILLELGQAMGKMGSAARLALVSSLFGKRSVGTGSVLATMADKFDDLGNAIDNAGGTAARTAKEMDSGLGGALRILWSAVEGVQIAIGEALSGAFTRVADRIGPLLGTLTEWIGKNKETVVTIMGTIVAVGLAGVAFMAFGLILKLAAIALGAIIALIGAMSAAVGLMLSPVTLIIVALGLLAAIVVTLGTKLFLASQAGQEALAGWAAGFTSMKDRALATLGGIKTALASGDIPSAMKLMWAAINLEWQNGLLAWRHGWNAMLKDIAAGLAALGVGSLVLAATVNTSSKGVLTAQKEYKTILRGIHADEEWRQQAADFKKIMGGSSFGDDVGGTPGSSGVPGFDELRAKQKAEWAARFADWQESVKPEEVLAGMSRSRGTFSGSAIAGLGYGGRGPMKQVEVILEKILTKTSQDAETNKMNNDELKRLTLEATA